jgi:hypothetical protein
MKRNGTERNGTNRKEKKRKEKKRKEKKRKEKKRKERKRKETKRNETKRNETKRNENKMWINTVLKEQFQQFNVTENPQNQKLLVSNDELTHLFTCALVLQTTQLGS